MAQSLMNADNEQFDLPQLSTNQSSAEASQTLPVANATTSPVCRPSFTADDVRPMVSYPHGDIDIHWLF